MTQHLVTQDLIKELVQREDADQVIGRALVALFYRQTDSEKATATTNTHNGVGFTGADARSGVLSAKFYLKNKRLEAWMVERWRKPASNGYPRLAKYWKQLDEVAQQKAAGTYVTPAVTVSAPTVKKTLNDVTTDLETWVKSKANYFDSNIDVMVDLVNKKGIKYNRVIGTNFSGLMRVVIDAYSPRWFRAVMNGEAGEIYHDYDTLMKVLNEKFP